MAFMTTAATIGTTLSFMTVSNFWDNIFTLSARALTFFSRRSISNLLLASASRIWLSFFSISWSFFSSSLISVSRS
ncbi:hypothetical protein HOY82DRAFT_549073 [Tuber indicum]|nr:hypothetical protein HOY82DRAFT_549073 [Tuber indicum]